MNPNSCCKGIAFFRISTASLMLILHGLPKLQNYTALSSQFPDPLGIGSMLSLTLVVFAEVFCSILVLLGVATRLATIPLIITMGVAFFIFHSADPFAVKELSLFFLLSFTTLFISGTGQYPIIKKCLPKTSNSKLNYLLERDFD